MNVPGFRAEASLYRTNARYTSTYTSTASNGQVVPQLPINCYLHGIGNYAGCLFEGLLSPDLCGAILKLHFGVCDFLG
jgi:hypothetical protein